MSPALNGLDELLDVTGRVRSSVEHVIEGKTEAVDMVLTVLLAEGHLLLEDVPGVGKTMLARALARTLDLEMHRIQFTPDLLPSDITGVSVYNQGTGAFEFKPGGIFANVVLGDEINRASPKTQAAMLESMEEQQVSTDGRTYGLPRPFMVIATQNPIEMEGTYPLPEAQRDRFMAKIDMGYPSPAAEVAMLDSHGVTDPLSHLRPVTDGPTLVRIIDTARQVHVAPELKAYLVGIVGATRRSPELRLGASPRATLHLLRASRAKAALAGRDYVSPDDIRDLAPKVLTHRVMPSAEAQLGRRTLEEIVSGIVRLVRVPGER